jgi:hypothetical protein
MLTPLKTPADTPGCKKCINCSKRENAKQKTVPTTKRAQQHFESKTGVVEFHGGTEKEASSTYVLPGQNARIDIQAIKHNVET